MLINNLGDTTGYYSYWKNTNNYIVPRHFKVPKVDLDVVKRQYAIACAKHNKREMKRLELLIANNQ